MPLVLSRKLGEAIVIDGPAELELHEVAHGKAKLVITAPQSTKILRKELVGDEDSRGGGPGSNEGPGQAGR